MPTTLGYTIQTGGPVAQGQSDRLITGWLEVRILPGPPVCGVMVKSERIAAYLRTELPQATEKAAEDVIRIPGGFSRESCSFDVRWCEGIGILEQLAMGRHAPARCSG